MGLQSALLAKNNFTGPYLFIDAYDETDFDKLTGDGSGDWLINSNYFKPFACCRWLHPAIQLSIELKTENHLIIDKIEKIEVKIFRRALELIESKYPENVIQAQFHLPFVLACALLFGQVTPDEISRKNIGNQHLLALIDKIKLVPHDRMSAAFPLELGSKVTITLKGKVISKSAKKAPWDSDRPPSDEALFQKFRQQTGEKALTLWKSFFAS
jgi:2-methylcitrate dehydratase PrpD